MTYHSARDVWDVDIGKRPRRIVYANDGSDTSFRALEVAFSEAERWRATLRIVLVSESLPRRESMYEVDLEKARQDAQIERLKRRIEAVAARFAVPHRIYSFTGHPVRHILVFVKEARADLLVIGATEHRTLIELIIGRRSDRIARRAHCPVLIVR
jgi:nucleotide-binding universal stress UspA family protein